MMSQDFQEKSKVWRFGNYMDDCTIWMSNVENGGFCVACGRPGRLNYFAKYEDALAFAVSRITEDMNRVFDQPQGCVVITSDAFKDTCEPDKDMRGATSFQYDISVADAINESDCPVNPLSEIYRTLCNTTAQLKACPEPDRYGMVSLASLESACEKLYDVITGKP